MSLDTVITADNIVEIGEKLTVGSFKMLVGYRGEVVLRLYKMLLKDLYCKHNPGYVLTDAYDYVQIACLYLCEHMGQRLGDIVMDRRNKKVGIKHACCSEVGHWFYKTIPNIVLEHLLPHFQIYIIYNVGKQKKAVRFYMNCLCVFLCIVAGF